MPFMRNSLFTGFLIWCLFFMAACGAGLTPDEYLANAKSHIDKNEYRAAAIELSNALQKDPNLLEARWLLATVAIELGEGAKAEKEINRAMELGLARQSGEPVLVKAIYLQSDWGRVLEESESLPEGMPKEDEALILALRGRAYLASRKFDEAKKSLDTALEIDPASSPALVGMAAFHGLQRDYGEARLWARRALEQDAASAEAWSALADVEMMEGNFEEAEAAFSKAIKFRQYVILDQAKRALMRAELEKYREAEADIQALEKHGFKKNPYVNYAKGVVYFKQGRYAEAAESFQASYTSRPDSLRTGIYLATTHLMLGNLEQAQSLAERISARAPRSQATRRLLGTILVNRMEYGTAMDVLRKSLAEKPDDPILLQMLANISLFNGNTSQGVSYAEKLVSLDPESRPARDLLSLARLMDGQKLDSGKDGDDDYTAEFLRAAAAFRQKNFGDALERASRLHEKYPEKVDPLNLIAACYLASGQWDKARTEMQKVLKLQPNEPSATKNLAKVEVRDGNPEHARALLQALLKASPADEEAVLLLAEIEGQTGGPDDVVRLLEQGLKDNPDSLAIRAKLASVYFRAAQFEKILELSQELSTAQLQQQPLLLELRAKAQMAEGDMAAASNSLERLVAAAPDSAHAHFLYGDSLARRGETARAREQMDRAVELDPRYFPARIGQIKVLFQQREMQKAKDALAAVRKDFGDRPEVQGIEGWFALVEGDNAAAVERFRLALEKKPDSDLTILLVKALWGQKKYDEALGVMRSWLEEHPKDIKVWLHLAGAYLDLGDEQKARDAYARVVEIYPQHVPALNNLAWLSRNDNLDSAIAYARQADQLAPNDPQVLDTLGMLLLEKGDIPRASRLIQRAADLSPENREIQLHLGQVLVQQKKYPAARKVLAALASAASEPRISAEAKALLASIETR